MPHLVVEYSNNVVEKHRLPELFKQLHLLLANMLPTNIDSCKSRGVERAVFAVGNGDPGSAFVHVSLKVLPGRSESILENTANRITALLEIFFEQSLAELNTQISLEITELQSTYYKIVSE